MMVVSSRKVICVFSFLFALTGVVRAEGNPTPVPKAVVTDFTYSDTSGEPRDQVAVHAGRLKSFNEKLRADLGGSTYSIVSLNCQSNCPSPDTNMLALVQEAENAGADLLVFGQIRKMSTLIQWAKVVAVDVKTKAPVLDRLLSFRGDSDEAWQRAETFIARDLVEHAAPKSP
jgi:hypothetical protein